MQISFDKEPVKGTQVEKTVACFIVSQEKGGVAGRLLFILMECASGQMLALSAAHIIHTASQDVIATGTGKGQGKREGSGVGWFTDMQIGSCSGNIITLPSTPGDGPRKTRRQLRVFFIFEAIKLRQIQLGGPD